jgi:hypothetical protein
MKINTLIELFTALAAINGDIELVVPDPTREVHDESVWTPNFLPFITEYRHEDGRTELIGMLLANPQNAIMRDADGNTFRPMEV